MSTTTDRHRTGIAALDRKIGGGIPEGTIVALSAPPASQSELLMARLAAQRETLYLTTERSKGSVRRAIEGGRDDPSGVRIVEVDRTDPLEDVRKHVRSCEAATLVVDPVDPLEQRDPGRFRQFLLDLSRRLAETGAVAVLHCLAGERTPADRDRTLYVADVVFDLLTRVDGDDVDNWLAVPKFRGGRALPETLRLELTERVGVDTSREIV